MSTNLQEEKSEKKNEFSLTRTIVDIKELDKVLKKGSNHGVCGGRNLGNTCFMNSSIACLSNCSELTTYFLTGKFENDINKNNKDGLQGDLAYAWNDLLQQYWNSDDTTGNPSRVKSTVARKVRKFAGFSQQDSNEFMTEFLSILSEDLNKTDKKEYKELKEKQKNETEFECAKRFWDLHVSLNDSIVTDLFSGLLKSEVHCSNCNYDNITFDPFNTLTLPIPSINDINQNLERLFYIPKYSIRKNCKLAISNVNKSLPLKNIIEGLKNINDFKYNLNKLKIINVLDKKLIKFVDENETIKKEDFIFIFDDLSKDEKTLTIPLYMVNNDALSAFPRLLFLEENIKFGQLKKKIYYYARNYFTNPLGTNNIDEELKKYKEQIEEYDEQKLWDLFDNEYKEIFESGDESKKDEIDKFLNDFPFKITIKKKFNDKESIEIFDGKNNLENLKEFEISKDEDPITNLLDKIKNNECYIYLEIKKSSSYTVEKISLNSFTVFEQEKRKGDNQLNLDCLLNYFSSRELLGKGNEWRCGNCNQKVEAGKKLSIYYVPKLLIICLSRFSKQGRYGYGKNDNFIDFPLDNLDMGKYICGPYKENSKYDLFAVSQHYGGTGGGHYTAICKNIDGNWYSYNDSSCSRSSPGNVVSSSAYVLFYRRRTW